MDELRMILLDLEGSGYYVLAECPHGWINLKKSPTNKATAEKLIEAFRSHYKVSVIEHSDFYGRMPKNCPGRVF